MNRTALSLDKNLIRKAKGLAVLQGITLSKWIENAMTEKINQAVNTGEALKSLATGPTMKPDNL